MAQTLLYLACGVAWLELSRSELGETAFARWFFRMGGGLWLAMGLQFAIAYLIVASPCVIPGLEWNWFERLFWGC